ncbi:glycosyltransferase [Oerskovia enterophila]|uniref:D-inositol 3-phosphate glycosyltransferase n=1 Tax=Oerskovia enterophila TaxID=43678 RepID=A0ABX2YCH1_9CELL|nr:glycosyltransferase [Oerskovia enterophila]OCI32666.1 D-inositol 3-phosphate glycosyltransferase [Oerskovia enterophila]
MRILRVSHSAVVDAWRERERALRALGLDVHLVSARSWDEAGTTVPLRPRPGEPVRGVRTVGTHPALFVYAPGPLWRALGESWDVLDVHEEPFALATAEILALRWLRAHLPGRSRRPAPPYVLYSAQNISKRYPWPFRAFERAALRGAAAVSVCNEAAARIVRAKGARGAVEVVPLGVDLSVFSPAPSPATPSDGVASVPAPRHPGRDSAGPHAPGDSPAGLVRVGYAGRLAPHKGVDVLLTAVEGDERLHLTLAGDGPSAPALRERARPLGDRVRFVGPLTGDDLVSFYRALDVLAVPSLDTPGWIEQFGRVAVEAMACGVPVVASDSGALPDVVGGAGLLVPPGDPVALHDALVRVADEPGLADSLRRRGAARAATCAWPEVARRYRAIYEEATARSSPPVGTTRRDADAQGGPAPSGSTERPAPEVVLVAYGSPDLVRDALAPLVGKLSLTVVDNSSLPTIQEVAELAGARYLDPGRNGGFAAGVNHGIRHRQVPGADVLLLNPDAVVTPEDVLTLQARLHEAPDLASVGPAQVDGDGESARVVWPYPSPTGTWVEAVGLGSLRRAPADRSFVIGSVLLLRADALEEVGLFDESFFLYAEETDWAYRATLLGRRHVAVPEVQALHLGGATSSDPTRRETHFHASQERYLRKHFGAVGWQLARTGVLAGSVARGVALRGEGRAAARRRVSLYLRGPLRAEAAVVRARPSPELSS